ncbi:Kinesin-like protein FRA1 [Abeliophyllum distichum]|uniref:Kinesin-like protein FRA1 n=1 Tax=Abeliophyllum distichum TaxID=126358 RepID=A0ABD1SU73_9LAMI
MEANSSGEDLCVKVAVHIRPLIGDEKLQGCKDCVSVVPGKPQMQIGSHSFTFDHVYGSSGSPSSSMYDECVAPLVDSLFQGYNATVLAYGQTGSGKTYTMGTSLKGGCQTGQIPKVMNSLFGKIETLKHEIEFQLHVSFIEIHKEEVRDLLDPISANKQETANEHAGKATIPGKPPIQIRETSNGIITLAGSTECRVKTLKEMADCLEQGSLSRATGSTNMNNQSRFFRRKTEEAAMATKRLKKLLEARQSSARDNSGNLLFSIKMSTPPNYLIKPYEPFIFSDYEIFLQGWLDHELEVQANVHEVRHERAALAEELAVLRQVDEFASKGVSPPRGKNGYSRESSMSTTGRTARIASLQNMPSISSNSLVAMASQLSEAEERERAFSSCGRWNQLRSMGDAKSLLQYMFSSLGDARCQLWEKEIESKEMKEQMKELVCQKQLKYTAGIANGSVRESATLMDQTRKMMPVGQLSMKELALVGQGGKLWRWKRSHHQWLLQFKWKWQKPWRLSEWIRHNDETIMRAKPRPQALLDVMYRN